MKCINCKKEIPDSAKACGFCGTKQVQPVPKPVTKPDKKSPTPAPTAVPAAKCKPKWLLTAVFAVLVIIAAVLVWKFVLSPSPAAEVPAPEAPKQPATPDNDQSENASISQAQGNWTSTFKDTTTKINIRQDSGSSYQLRIISMTNSHELLCSDPNGIVTGQGTGTAKGFVLSFDRVTYKCIETGEEYTSYWNITFDPSTDTLMDDGNNTWHRY